MSDPIVMADTDDPGTIIDRVLRAMAILDTYTAALTDEYAEDRYVMWTVRDILDQVTSDLERIPVPDQAQASAKFTEDDADRTPLPGLPPARPCPFCGTVEDINIAEQRARPPTWRSTSTTGSPAASVEWMRQAPTQAEAAVEWNKRGVRP